MPTAPPNRLDFPRFLPVGDTGLLVEFGDAISLSLNMAVVELDRSLAKARLPGLVESVPTYRSLLIEYEPALIRLPKLIERIKLLLRASKPRSHGADRQLLVPVAYDEGSDEDLATASGLLGLKPDAVISAHVAAHYRVYMIGFMPGFAYLGGLPPELHLPRRNVVRSGAPEGSIMIGGIQAAIAARPLRTGWYVIGRTPVRGFDKTRAEPFLFRAGDNVRFRQIDDKEFERLVAKAAEGSLVIEVVE